LIYKRGRVLHGNYAAATPLVAMLPVEHAAVAPTWLERLPAPTPRELFAPPAAARPLVPSLDAERIQLDAERRALAAERAQLQATQARWMEALAKLAGQAVAPAPPAQLVLEVALAVAREVVGHDVNTNKQLVLQTIEELLQAVHGEQQVELRLSPSDLDAVRALKPELATQVRLVADASLGPGGCIVETPRQVLDGSLERRMAAVRAALRELPTANDNGVAEPAARVGASNQ
jgi:vacuolar-type H+-ATPase subunit E/Vma4